MEVHIRFGAGPLTRCQLLHPHVQRPLGARLGGEQAEPRGVPELVGLEERQAPQRHAPRARLGGAAHQVVHQRQPQVPPPGVVLDRGLEDAHLAPREQAVVEVAGGLRVLAGEPDAAEVDLLLQRQAGEKPQRVAEALLELDDVGQVAGHGARDGGINDGAAGGGAAVAGGHGTGLRPGALSAPAAARPFPLAAASWSNRLRSRPVGR